MTFIKNSRVYKTLKLLLAGFGQFKFVLAGLLVLSFLNGILEGVGISAVVPLFSFINQGKAGGADAITKLIENIFVFLGLPYTLKFLLIFIVALFIAKAAVLFFTSYFSARIMAEFE